MSEVPLTADSSSIQNVEFNIFLALDTLSCFHVFIILVTLHISYIFHTFTDKLASKDWI